MAELDIARISKAALHLAGRRGADGFTMRALADSLGVTPMALYRHVADKTALVALVLDESLSERRLPSLTGDWREDLWRQARWSRERALAHPAVYQLHRAYQTWTPAMIPLAERWTGLWRESGLTAARATRASVASSLAVNGYVEAELRLRSFQPPSAKLLADVPNARRVVGARPGGEADYELTVRSLLDGIHTRLASVPARRSA
ncbi:MAG TPA: TetR family transcriptional regulator [Acidimicrobiia bacterium]